MADEEQRSVYPEVEVAVTATITDIEDIEQTVKAEFIIFTLFKGEPLNPDGRDRFVLVGEEENIFTPDIDVSLIVDDVQGGWKTITKINEVTGEVLTCLRNTIDVAQEFSVNSFPFDTQEMKFSFVCSNARLVTWKSDPSYVKDYNQDFVAEVRDWDENDVHFFRSIAPNWRLEQIDIFERTVDENDTFIFPGKITFNLTIKRDPGYFGLNYVLTIYLIVATNLSVVGIPVTDASGRMGIVVTLLLTLVALKLVLADISPRSATPTYVDTIIFLGFVLMFIIVLEIVVIRFIAEGFVEIEGIVSDEDENQSQELDEGEVRLETADFVFHIVLFFMWTLTVMFHSCGGYACSPLFFACGKAFKLKKNSKFIGYHLGADKRPTKLQRYVAVGTRLVQDTKDTGVAVGTNLINRAKKGIQKLGTTVGV